MNWLRWLGPFGRMLVQWEPRTMGTFPVEVVRERGWTAKRIESGEVETWEVAA